MTKNKKVVCVEEVKALLRARDDNTWRLSGLLAKIYNGDLYKGLGFESWSEFVLNYTNLTLRAASFYVLTDRWLRKRTKAEKKWLKEIGWSRYVSVKSDLDRLGLRACKKKYFDYR